MKKAAKKPLLKRVRRWYRQRQDAWRASWRTDMDRPVSRLQAHIDLMLFDHGFLRTVYANRDEFAPGLWRSNQPSPRTIRLLARQGVRTILNLRGENGLGAYALEERACARHGVTLRSMRLLSRDLPRREEVHEFLEILRTAERPMLIHCKSGADRAGLAAAIHYFAEGDIEAARRQLSLRYLHVRQARTGILDHFVEAYASAHAETGISFVDWIDTGYDRDRLAASFKSSGAADLLVGGVLRRE